MLPPLKPFISNSSNLEIIDLSFKLSDDIDYQIDSNTIKEELPISSSEMTSVPENEQQSYIDNNYIDNEEFVIEESSENDIILQEDIISDINENEIIDISEPIEKHANEESIENTTDSEIEHVNTTQISFNNEQELDEIVYENEMNIKNEDMVEITEVFKDLAFLDSQENEESRNPERKENSENKNEKVLEDHNSEDFYKYTPANPQNYESLSEMLSEKDMSKIIEYVFDYDMEDYHDILDKISQSNDEVTALELMENYCKNNHIECSAEEVDNFKSYIAEYYTKSYS